MEKEKQAARNFWNKSPAGTAHSEGNVPGSQELYEKVRAKRNSYELPTVLELIPFESFKEKKILEIGFGQGFDAYEFCQHGCDYTGVDIAPNNIKLATQHMSYYGFNANFIEGDAENLPLENHIFDVVFSNGVLMCTPNMKKSFQEAQRVLKDKGDFWIVLYNKHSIFYWLQLILYSQILRLGFFKNSLKKRLSRVEHSLDGDEAPNVLVKVCTKKGVKKLLKETGFQISNMWIRKLNKEDLPTIPFIQKLWPKLSPRFLQTLEKRWGWYLIAHAKKIG